MTPYNDRIAEALSFDPLAEAERITGSSYKDDKSTAFLGMFLAMEQSSRKARLLQESNDTCNHNNLAQNVQVVESLGFQLLESGTFQSAGMGDEGQEEQWSIYWRDGILLFLDSFRGNLNSGHAYFNYRLNPGSRSLTGYSGGFTLTPEGDRVAYGSIDIREGLRHRLTTMEENGEFLSQWVERPFLWLLHHSDTKVPGYDHEAITKQRISLLSQDVQDAVTPVPTDTK